jgi:hypothetical protein
MAVTDKIASIVSAPDQAAKLAEVREGYKERDARRGRTGKSAVVHGKSSEKTQSDQAPEPRDTTERMRVFDRPDSVGVFRAFLRHATEIFAAVAPLLPPCRAWL